MKYHLDHPQIKRNKSMGNGKAPKSHTEHPQLKGKQSSCDEAVDKHEDKYHKDDKSKK